MASFFWQSKPWQAFKTFAIIFSFIVNFILIIVLLIAAPLILPIVSEIAVPIVGGLTTSFEDMNNASIVQTIVVDDDLDIAFTLPLNQQTDVVLAAPVPLNVQAQFLLPGGGGNINGNVSIELPAGTVLPVQLKLDVPVQENIPVLLNVPVEIPLSETELGAPFSNLQAIFSPLDDFLGNLPADNDELRARLGNSLTASPESTEEQADTINNQQSAVND